MADTSFWESSTCTICGNRDDVAQPSRRPDGRARPPALQLRHVSLRSKYCARGTYRGRHSAEPCPCARHDLATPAESRQIAGVESSVRRISEVFRRSTKTGERYFEAAGGLVSALDRYLRQRNDKLNSFHSF